MRAYEIQPKMFYVNPSGARVRYRIWVEDVTLYEDERMIQITYKWVQHSHRNVTLHEVITQRFAWDGYWQYIPEVYEITELP